MKYVSHSPAQTHRGGKMLAGILRPGDVLGLSGELGAGKTCFIQGVAHGLGVEEKYVTSPSFVLIREYRGKIPFYHIDLYRISPKQDLFGLGLEDYLGGSGVCAIEWAEKAKELLPPGALRINLRFRGERVREIEVEGLSKERRRELEERCRKRPSGKK